MQLFRLASHQPNPTTSHQGEQATLILVGIDIMPQNNNLSIIRLYHSPLLLLGFEIVPLDFDSDPNFDVIEGGQLSRGAPAVKVASSLTNTDPDSRNPIHQQGQATFFDHDSAPPPTTTTPKPVSASNCKASSMTFLLIWNVNFVL